MHGIAVVLAIRASIFAHRGHPPSAVVGPGTSCAAAASEAAVVFDMSETQYGTEKQGELMRVYSQERHDEEEE
jgi:hypothetical protein